MTDGDSVDLDVTKGNLGGDAVIDGFGAEPATLHLLSVRAAGATTGVTGAEADTIAD